MHRKSSVAAIDMPLRDQPVSAAIGCRKTASENIAPMPMQVISMPAPTTTQPYDSFICTQRRCERYARSLPAAHATSSVDHHANPPSCSARRACFAAVQYATIADFQSQAEADYYDRDRDLRKSPPGMKPATAPSALKVQAVLGPEFQVLEFEASTRTSQEAAAAIGCTVAEIAKSLIFRSADGRAVLVIASG